MRTTLVSHAREFHMTLQGGAFGMRFREKWKALPARFIRVVNEVDLLSFVSHAGMM